MADSKVLYYVTNSGLAAALGNPDVAETMRGVVLGTAHPQTTRSFHKRGFVEVDRRGATRTDHNTLIISGAVERVRSVLLHSGPEDPAPAPEPPSHRSLVRYSVAPEPPTPALSPTCEKVLAAMQSNAEGLTFAELRAALPDVNEGTLRWAIQELRRKRFAMNDDDRETAAA